MQRNHAPAAKLMFSTKDCFNHLSEFISAKDLTTLEIMTDIATSAYLSALCLIFPHSVIQYNTVENMTMKTADMLTRVNVDRLTQYLANELHGPHSRGVVADETYDQIEKAISHIVDDACDDVKGFFEPNKRDIFTTGASRNYKFDVNDGARGRVIVITINDLH